MTKLTRNMNFWPTCGCKNLFWKSTFILVNKLLNLSVLNIKKLIKRICSIHVKNMPRGFLILCKTHKLICPSHVFIQKPYNEYCFMQTFSSTVQTINHIPDQIQNKLWIKLRREIILKNVDNWISCDLFWPKMQKEIY